MSKLYNLSAESFSAFGKIIESDGTKPFEVVVSVPEAKGWRIAVSTLKRKTITKLGLHPNTHESFEPISGVAVIIVAPLAQPENWRAYFLYKPVCLFPNIWHATLALSQRAVLKVMENNHVESLHHLLSHPIGFRVVEEDNNNST